MATHKKGKKSYMDIPVVKELYSMPDEDSQLVFGAIAIYVSTYNAEAVREWLSDKVPEEKLNYFVDITMRALKAMK